MDGTKKLPDVTNKEDQLREEDFNPAVKAIATSKVLLGLVDDYLNEPDELKRKEISAHLLKTNPMASSSDVQWPLAGA